MALDDITDRIKVALARAARPPGAVELIAVSKVQPAARVRAVLDQGHRVFGENRVQAAAERWPPLRAAQDGSRLHLSGPLQSNKARRAVALFDTIQTLDRLTLAHRLAELAQELGACPDLFVQVNTGAEAQKAGVPPADTDNLVAQARALDLPVHGLMCIPPVGEEASLHFALLAKIAARNGLTDLSMGMSADFETAIAFGATHVRVGSALFGPRAPA